MGFGVWGLGFGVWGLGWPPKAQGAFPGSASGQSDDLSVALQLRV